MTVMDIIYWLARNALLLTCVVFALLVATVYWPGRRARFEHDAMIPLRDDR
jgi:cbb3-type cytochrome oxidase subunit 3